MSLEVYLIQSREMFKIHDSITKRWNALMNGQPTDDTLNNMTRLLEEYSSFMAELQRLSPPPEYHAYQSNIEKGVHLTFEAMELHFLFGRQWRKGKADTTLLDDAERLLTEAKSAMDNARAIAWEQKQ